MSNVIGLCKICKQGELNIVEEIHTGTLFIHCDECMAEWTTAESALEGKNGTRFKFSDFIEAELDRIIEIGWDKLLRKSTSQKKYKLINWSEFKERFEDCFGVCFSSTDRIITDFNLSSSDFIVVKSFDTLENQDLLSVFEDIVDDELVLISDTCYLNSPFLVKYTNLKEFLMEYFEEFRECIFDGDIFLISFRYKIIWIFHHEGVKAKYIG